MLHRRASLTRGPDALISHRRTHSCYIDASLTLGLPPHAHAAILVNQLWLALLPAHLSSRRLLWPRRAPLLVGGFAVLTYCITLGRNVGSNSLSGGVFSLLISTSIFWNVVLGRCFLARQLGRWDILAAVLCVAAATVLGVSEPSLTASLSTAWGGPAGGIAATLAAALCAAASSVWLDRMGELDEPADRDARQLALALFASLATTALLLPTLWLSGEHAAWGPQLRGAWAAGGASRATLLGCSLGLPAVKALARTAKFKVVFLSNSFAFEVAQASAALVSAFVNVLIFAESVSAAFGASALLIGLACAAYLRGRAVLKAARAREHLAGIHHHAGPHHAHGVPDRVELLYAPPSAGPAPGETRAWTLLEVPVRRGPGARVSPTRRLGAPPT